jgi:hypothetical protein
MSIVKRMAMVAAVTVALIGLTGAMSTASAQSDDEVENRGDCTGISDWHIRIRTDGPNLLDLTWEAGEVAGQQWRVRMVYNGDTVFSGITTSGADGEFDIDVEVDNQAGLDVLRATARNMTTGEVCRGSVSANF